MKTPDIELEEYNVRRNKVLTQMGPHEVALIQGGPKESASERFRQTNDFYYFCKAEVPHAYLLLDGRTSDSHLFLPSQPQSRLKSEGPLLNSGDPDTARSATGVDGVHDLGELAGFLEKATVIYTPLRQGEGARMSWDTLQRAQQEAFSDPWDGRPDRMRWFANLLKTRSPAAEIRDLSPIINEIRLKKSDNELALMRRAGQLSARGVIEAMKSTRPGMTEYQLEALMRYQYLIHGARDVSYNAIVASGDNAWYGHYNANDAELLNGDLILVDCAPDYHYYSSDIGRMWPINGRYNAVQRELYGFMVEYHKVLLSLLKPGTTDDEVHKQAAEVMASYMADHPFSKPIYTQAAERALVFPYHLSHPVGMSVHDVGHYRGKLLEPGIVLTVDPQMIIPEERRYVRVEDTVVITEDGIENFTEAAPLELDDVEACMKEQGMFEYYPADVF